jgi:hypothetical protein
MTTYQVAQMNVACAIPASGTVGAVGVPTSTATLNSLTWVGALSAIRAQRTTADAERFLAVGRHLIDPDARPADSDMFQATKVDPNGVRIGHTALDRRRG